MSPMSGLELLANMRMRGYAVPVILMTAFPDEDLRTGAQKVGASGFIAKPFSAPNLVACLDTTLASQGGNVGA
jgi:FixJ family two-component response regulator